MRVFQHAFPITAAGPGKGPQRDDGGSGTLTEVAPKSATKRKLQRPRLWKVILLNDDFTPMEFVTLLLQEVFHHGEASALAIMLSIHRTGAGVAGVFTHEVAETKVQQVIELAQQNDHPLQCTMEPDDDGKSEDEE